MCLIDSVTNHVCIEDVGSQEALLLEVLSQVPNERQQVQSRPLGMYSFLHSWTMSKIDC